MKTYPIARPSGLTYGGTKAVATGEFRCPKAGEWFLSGAIIEAYQTKNDLRIPYHIARLVQTKIIQTEVILGG